MESFRSYPGKILLFGEYTVLDGSKALAIPYDEYQGNFKEGYDQRIENYFNWLKEQDLPLDPKKLDTYSKTIEFDSNIPEGYGVGSSGALVAATYDLCKAEDDLPKREVLAAMESYFHDSSSGLDPMVSYYKKAFVLNDGEVESIDFNEELLPYFSLYDSSTTRSTSKLVKLYKYKLAKDNFRDATEWMTEINNRIISDLTANEEIDPYEIQRLSTLQREWLEDFIPNDVKEEWDKTFEDGVSIFKLCGAGGGGFFLEFDIAEED